MTINDTTTTFDPQPGDNVAIVTPSNWGLGGGSVEFVNVDRLTKTQVIVIVRPGRERRFRRSDFREVAAGSRSYIADVDDPHVTALAASYEADVAYGVLVRFIRSASSRRGRKEEMTEASIAEARAALDVIEAAFREGR